MSEAWLNRAHGELSTAAVFECLAKAARELGAASQVLELVERAAIDEVRHARRCHELSELYAARSLPSPVAAAFAPPLFGDAPAHVNRHLLLVYQSCLNEGIATVYLQENLRLARAPEAHRLIRELLRDDVVHARIGWAHLASPLCGAEVRRHVEAALPTLLRMVREAWLGACAASDFDCPDHGCLARSRHEPIVNAAIAELILPGFAHLGIPVPEQALQRAAMVPIGLER